MQRKVHWISAALFSLWIENTSEISPLDERVERKKMKLSCQDWIKRCKCNCSRYPWQWWIIWITCFSLRSTCCAGKVDFKCNFYVFVQCRTLVQRAAIFCIIPKEFSLEKIHTAACHSRVCAGQRNKAALCMKSCKFVETIFRFSSCTIQFIYMFLLTYNWV